MRRSRSPRTPPAPRVPRAPTCTPCTCPARSRPSLRPAPVRPHPLLAPQAAPHPFPVPIRTPSCAPLTSDGFCRTSPRSPSLPPGTGGPFPGGDTASGTPQLPGSAKGPQTLRDTLCCSRLWCRLTPKGTVGLWGRHPMGTAELQHWERQWGLQEAQCTPGRGRGHRVTPIGPPQCRAELLPTPPADGAVWPRCPKLCCSVSPRSGEV